ncbi:hypothetical protein GCM10009038_37470 [Salinicola rhizosphaerae]|uniref:Uncharacterized protein n=2 Tax=Salinicola rhizosphaerae TaxID=1443141 RepID=A0ABQ3EE15_9GAMM|nr:hypothetical protein GCM10009038_37470 [Salinicola rhizosphaerae]
MGSVTHWSWQDRPGHWQTLERPEEAPRISWLELNRNQWLSIDRFAALNRSLRRLQAIAPDWPQDMVHWRWLDDTMRYLDETFGLPAEDQQFVAESAARYHPDLVMHPDIESQLNQAALAPPGAADRLRQFNNTAWNTIISDLKERT